MTLLGSFLQAELNRRDISPEELGRRSGLGTSHIYQIIRGTKEPRLTTIAKIASGLGMATGELMAAVDSESSDDPVEQAIRQRSAAMREVVQDIPRVYWAAVIEKIFDRAIDSAKDVADLITGMPTSVTGNSEPAVTKPKTSGNRGKTDSEAELRNWKQVHAMHSARLGIAFVTPVAVASR